MVTIIKNLVDEEDEEEEEEQGDQLYTGNKIKRMILYSQSLFFIPSMLSLFL